MNHDERGKQRKKSKRRKEDSSEADKAGFVRGSGVNYSKVSDRHVDDDRYEKHKLAAVAPSNANGSSAAAAPANLSSSVPSTKISSQMAAVMRIMTGKEERTIAEKLADSNRPTWEQYKKENEDKLDIGGLDQKKMEAYRRELDEQREKLLTRGLNHRKEKNSKKSKRKKKKRRRRYDDSDSDQTHSSDSYSSYDSDRDHKRKKDRKRRYRKSDRKKVSREYDSDSCEGEEIKRKSSRHKKKKGKKKKKSDSDSSGGDSYRLSSFFSKGSENESD